MHEAMPFGLRRVSSPLLLPLLSAVRGIRALHPCHPLAPLRSAVSQQPLLLRRREAVRGGAGLWTWGSVLSASASPPDQPEPGNIFAKIIRGEASADVLENGDELFSFVDIKPASTYHYLVIPKKRYIRDASMLEASDAELVQRMRSKAVALVQASVGDAFDERELALGFHWPPWYSVPWLHLHAIYPRREMTRRYKYTPFSFKSPEWVLERIRTNEERGRPDPARRQSRRG